MKKLILLISISLLLVPVLANAGTIYGTVWEQNSGLPVKGASIQGCCITPTNGTYSVTYSIAGYYWITASKTNYNNWSNRYYVPAGIGAQMVNPLLHYNGPALTISGITAGGWYQNNHTYIIRWTIPTNGAIKVVLKLMSTSTGCGASGYLKTITNITNNGSYVLTIPADAPDDAYKIRITAEDIEGESVGFNISP